MFQRSGRLICALLAFSVVAIVGFAGTARAETDFSSAMTAVTMDEAKMVDFKVCPEAFGIPDEYALCYTAECWTLDQVAYCKCDLKNGDSISLPFNYEEDGKDKDVCDIFIAGIDNGFTVSTYSPPRQMQKNYKPGKEKLGPPMALYTCPGVSGLDSGYSAQCDGGLCFKSTSDTEFPGLGNVAKDEIICSCPPVPNTPIGFQMAGPWHCDPGDTNADGQCCDATYMDQYCNVDSVLKTGTSLVISSPPGLAVKLAKTLEGKRPKFNKCR